PNRTGKATWHKRCALPAEEEEGRYDPETATPAVAETGLHGLHDRAGALLLAPLRPDELPLLLRPVALLHPGGGLDGELAADLDAGRRHPAPPGLLDDRLPVDRGRPPELGPVQLYVRPGQAAVHAGPVVLPLLAAHPDRLRHREAGV